MKILKTLLWIIGLLVAGLLIFGAVAKKDFSTAQSTVINAPTSLVFNTINDLSTWDSWSPWSEQDPTNVSTMGDKYVGTGGSYTWSGDKMGTGKMSITDSQPPNKISTLVEFDGQGEAEADFTFEPVEGGTKTSWSFNSHAGFPSNIFMHIFGVEKQVGKDYARGLDLLKEKVEKMASSEPVLNVQELDYPGQTFIIHREQIGMDQIAEFYQKYLPTLASITQKNDFKMAGMPSGLYFAWDRENNKTDMAAAMPIIMPASTGGRTFRGINFYEIKPGKALQVNYSGDYSGIGAAHDAIGAHMKANGQEMVWPCVEEYVTDPGTEPDPNKWLTQVTYRLQ